MLNSDTPFRDAVPRTVQSPRRGAARTPVHPAEPRADAAGEAVPGWLPAVRRLLAGMQILDPDLREHVDRVAGLCRRIGAVLGLAGARAFDLRIAALVHDVGKLGLPRRLLHKPGRLTPDELRVLRSHCARGERLLRGLRLPEAVCRCVRSHHERFDGRGYPDRLAGGRIPLEARVLSVADVFDAVTESRPYRSPWSPQQAMGWIAARAGTLFDPDVVDGLERVREGVGASAPLSAPPVPVFRFDPRA